MKKINEVGKKYGYWSVLSESKKRSYGKLAFNCECKCGSQKIIVGSELRMGRTMSCGCLSKELKTKHGMSETRQYQIYNGIKKRCLNRKSKSYINYGGRGIKICQRWMKGFENFWEDMKEGYSDDLTIDRIDNDGDYCKENCRWADMETQLNNRRNSVFLTFGGVTKTISQWERKLKTKGGTLKHRVYYGFDDLDIITKPIKKNIKKHRYNGKMYTVKELSEISNIKTGTIYSRIYTLGYSIENAVEKPVMRNKL